MNLTALTSVFSETWRRTLWDTATIYGRSRIEIRNHARVSGMGYRERSLPHLE